MLNPPEAALGFVPQNDRDTTVVIEQLGMVATDMLDQYPARGILGLVERAAVDGFHVGCPAVGWKDIAKIPHKPLLRFRLAA